MADRKGLGFFGFVLGVLTAAVMAIALTVVLSHIDGSLALEAMESAGLSEMR